MSKKPTAKERILNMLEMYSKQLDPDEYQEIYAELIQHMTNQGIQSPDLQISIPRAQKRLAPPDNDIEKVLLSIIASKEGITSGYYEAWEVSQIASNVAVGRDELWQQGIQDMDAVHAITNEPTLRIADIVGYVRRIATDEKLSRIDDKGQRVTPFFVSDVTELAELFANVTMELDRQRQVMVKSTKHIRPDALAAHNQAIAELGDIIAEASRYYGRFLDGLRKLINGHDEGESLKAVCREMVDYSVIGEYTDWINAYKTPGRNKTGLGTAQSYLLSIARNKYASDKCSSWPEAGRAAQRELKSILDNPNTMNDEQILAEEAYNLITYEQHRTYDKKFQAQKRDYASMGNYLNGLDWRDKKSG
jgi:hypothetical protein